LTLHVNLDHTGAGLNRDGTDPENPLDTMAEAVANLSAWHIEGRNVDFSTIVLSGSLEGTHTESVSILDYTQYPSYCSIVGVGPGPFAPAWDSGAAASPCLVLGAVGWRVSGIRFYVPAAETAIVLPSTQAPYGADAIGIRTILDNNYFDGSVNTGLRGIDLHGAPYNVSIVGNIFGFIDAVGGMCIASTNTGLADAYRTYIADNWFHESVGGIDASLNVSVVRGNTFNTAGATAMTTVIDLRGGTQGENTVTDNDFGNADYSNPGGFYANAANPGGWSGNRSQDTAEAEVGDNGFTVLPPAA